MNAFPDYRKLLHLTLHHIYVVYLAVTGIGLFTLILLRFLQLLPQVVPKRFLKHFNGNLSGTIKLESPNHGWYDVRVTKCFNKVVFRHGWGKFIDSHHIEENDYLLFRHIDKSCFEVLILDSDGCEKVFPCAGIRNTPRFKGRSAEYVDTSSNSHHEITESSASETAKMGATSSPSESGYTVNQVTCIFGLNLMLLICIICLGFFIYFIFFMEKTFHLKKHLFSWIIFRHPSGKIMFCQKEATYLKHNRRE